MSYQSIPPRLPRRNGVLRHFSGTIILVLVAIFMLAIAALFTVRVQKVGGTEIGVKVNNLSGGITVIPESGTYIYNGFINSFFLLDTTVQRLEMTADTTRSNRDTRDDLRIKTIDGSDVFLDLTINYQIRRDKIEEVVNTSGLGDAYKVKWVRDYARSVSRTVFGEMTTEQFYDASVRNEKALKTEVEMNGLLKPFGIEVTRVIAEKFRFHPEYEDKIRAKKLADQEVEEQMSKANAAKQNQIFRTVEATKKKDVIIATFEGQMRQLIVQAEAEANKAIKGAEAYAIQTERGADASFYTQEQNAKAILAQGKAQAQATEVMAQALEGEGGRNLVKMAYADRLKGMNLTGQPFTISGETERFTTVDEAAAANKVKKDQSK
ncbi:SPFH domain-containing protein [Cerasicoccus fimbriatus]|uniref:SPFH domain-containing protein n=1 Tax=Cerasicoccus fimbriatus TaxID=3014554 RepID=UPI0022B31579|nr:SPFH domain-containing protein [Cerasicoccus sp. TK19100]